MFAYQIRNSHPCGRRRSGLQNAGFSFSLLHRKSCQSGTPAGCSSSHKTPLSSHYHQACLSTRHRSYPQKHIDYLTSPTIMSQPLKAVVHKTVAVLGASYGGPFASLSLYTNNRPDVIMISILWSRCPNGPSSGPATSSRLESHSDRP